MDQKPNIAVDFDGTLFTDEHEPFEWAKIDGKPTKSAKEALQKLSEHFRIVIFSARARREEGKEAIEKRLKEEGMPFDEVTAVKPAASRYVDDWGVQFKGDWDETLKDIVSFKHWDNKEEKEK